MPKIIEYPRASFIKCMEMAEAVDYLGGSSSPDSCADKMGLKVSGAFNATISAASKHGLIENKKGKLVVSPDFKKIKHAYDKDEENAIKQTFFLAAPLYSKVYERFKGKPLPIDMLERILIREFGVEEGIAQRVVGYFIDGATYCELLVNGKLVVEGEKANVQEKQEDQFSGNGEEKRGEVFDDEAVKDEMSLGSQSKGEKSFYVSISGAGINTKLTVSEEEDFVILEAVINKLKKKLKNGNE